PWRWARAKMRQRGNTGRAEKCGAVRAPARACAARKAGPSSPGGRWSAAVPPEPPGTARVPMGMNGDLWPYVRPIQRFGLRLMPHFRTILPGTAALLLLALGCAAIKKTASMPTSSRDAEWAAIDSLAGIGQYAS